MRKILRTAMVVITGLSALLFSTCEKPGHYDLFPLKVGNEYYYKYNRSRMFLYVSGIEAWKVISESLEGNSRAYTIERNLNATQIVLLDTLVISDSTRYLEVIEEKSSSMISVFGYNFARYQDVSEIELKTEDITFNVRTSYVFKADSGITKYLYSHGPNQWENEELILDSLNIFK